MIESFIMYRSFHEALKELTREQYGNIMFAINEYALDGKTNENLSGIEKAIFLMAKPQIDANRQRRENGCLGGRPRNNQTQRQEEQVKPQTSQNTIIEEVPPQGPEEICQEELNNIQEDLNNNQEMPSEIKKPMVFENEKPKKPMVFENSEIEKPNVNVNVNDNVNVNVNENVNTHTNKDKENIKNVCVPVYIPDPRDKIDKDLTKIIFNTVQEHNKATEKAHRVPISSDLFRFSCKEMRELLTVTGTEETGTKIKIALGNFLKVCKSDTWLKSHTWSTFCRHYTDYTPEFFTLERYLNAEPQTEDASKKSENIFFFAHKDDPAFHVETFQAHIDDWKAEGRPDGADYIALQTKWEVGYAN